ncbi:MBOAT family O-acyltransferase [Lysinibacillus sp. KU-BSD001]|uniref:MBOAT family O-acyltransferase n=1 Tax=Lysinibacillus sp. KU-BSD001 TaxID=3141328 RepID=UPI0036E3AE84
MLFNSFVFAFVFLPIVFCVYFLLGRLKNKDISTLFLVAASLYFYSYFEIKFLYLISFSMAFNYAIGYILMKATSYRKGILSVGIIFNICILGYFKYADFFIENYNWIFDQNLDFLYLALPLGISFITFQQIAYLVDIYRGEITHSKLSSYMIFSTFFPQLIAGPIVNHKDVMQDYEDPKKKRINWENVSKGSFIFLIGLVKKIVIADTFALWVTDGFNNYTDLTFTEAWFVIIAYTVQLYFDFSGYCDMAIGLALMFNIHIPVNFNSPYKARNIHEFWRRWHMTLNRFLTKYVYFPLGGSRKGEMITALNIMLVFFISGFWHGAGWTFIIWGMLHGIGSVFLRFIKKYTNLQFPFLFSWFVTFLFIILARVYFRSESVAQAHHIFGTLFTPDVTSVKAFLTTPSAIFADAAAIEVAGYALNTPFILIGGLVIMLGICFFAKNSIELLHHFKFNWPHIWFVQCLAILLLATLFFVKKSSVFIYFNF